MKVQSSAVTITRPAVPKCSIFTSSSESPASSAITVPPQNAAMSPRCWMRRCPKPGARTATASSVPCCVLDTSMPSALASAFSQRMMIGRGSLASALRIGRRSFGCLSALFVMKTYGFSKTVSIRCTSRTMYCESQPFSTTTPSTKRTPMPGSSDSSIVTTPSAPTCVSASATMPPMTSSSLAAIVATCTSSSPSTVRATRCSSATMAAVASSMPRRSSIGLAPSSSACMPSRTIA